MKKISALFLALLMLLSLCACGSASSDGSGASYRAAQANTAAVYEESGVYAAASTADAGGFSSGAGAVWDADEAYEAPLAPGAADDAAPAENPEKIIYTADVTVETTVFEDALGQVDALLASLGGWVESSSVNGSNYSDLSRGTARLRSASYTLRIPSERFDEMMGRLSTLGNVPYTHVYTENVTAQYYDVQAHRNAYQVQEARLLALMEQAESVDDVIAIEERLGELRYQIESLEATLLNWDRHVSYSTVYLQLNEVREYTPDVPVRLSFGEQLGRALRSGLHSVGVFFREALLWLVEALPALLLLAVVIAALWLLIRRSLRKRRARRSQPQAEGK